MEGEDVSDITVEVSVAGASSGESIVPAYGVVRGGFFPADSPSKEEVMTTLIREWSLFTAGGGDGISKIACTQNVPPSITAHHVFAPPLRTCALKSCTQILPPSEAVH